MRISVRDFMGSVVLVRPIKRGEGNCGNTKLIPTSLHSNLSVAKLQIKVIPTLGTFPQELTRIDRTSTISFNFTIFARIDKF